VNVPVDEEKRALREAMRGRRRAVTVEQAREAGAQAARVLAAHFRALTPLLSDGRVALLYSALPGEVDTLALDGFLRRQGLDVAYPRVDGESLALHLAHPSELAPGKFAIAEPSTSARSVAAGALALVVVPGLAFDFAGGRLGFGGGYFDALLASAPRALRVGLCFSHQLQPRVPEAAHDARMDYLLVADDEALHPTGARR